MNKNKIENPSSCIHLGKVRNCGFVRPAVLLFCLAILASLAHARKEAGRQKQSRTLRQIQKASVEGRESPYSQFAHVASSDRQVIEDLPLPLFFFDSVVLSLVGLQSCPFVGHITCDSHTSVLKMDCWQIGRTSPPWPRADAVPRTSHGLEKMARLRSCSCINVRAATHRLARACGKGPSKIGRQLICKTRPCNLPRADEAPGTTPENEKKSPSLPAQLQLHP